MIIRIKAKQYEDYDDCLAAAAAAVAEERGLRGYDLNPRWGDEEGNIILVDVPSHSRTKAEKLAEHLYKDDQSRADEVPVCSDGGEAYDNWWNAASNAGDHETLEALEAVDRDDFAEAWDTCVAVDEVRKFRRGL